MSHRKELPWSLWVTIGFEGLEGVDGKGLVP